MEAKNPIIPTLNDKSQAALSSSKTQDTFFVFALTNHPPADRQLYITNEKI